MTLDVYERLGTRSTAPIDDVVILDADQRDKGRLKLVSVTGREVRVFLDRGKTLAIGELLRATNGEHVLVQGAMEDLLVAQCNDWRTFARACYHLGNRHVRIQVGELWIRLKPDHVLADMLEGLGMQLLTTKAVFEPEAGAYHGHAHSHSSGHAH